MLFFILRYSVTDRQTLKHTYKYTHTQTNKYQPILDELTKFQFQVKVCWSSGLIDVCVCVHARSHTHAHNLEVNAQLSKKTYISYQY